MFSSSTIVSASSDQVSCDLAGEAAILNLNNGTYYGLDALGAEIWTLIQEPKSVSQVCETIARDYDVEMARCETDVVALFTELHKEGLVQVQNAASA